MFTIHFAKQAAKLAWPISLQSILVTLLGMVDIIMVSHLGDSAVAAVGISNRIFFVFLIIVTGIASGVGVLSAQYFGAGQLQKIKNGNTLRLIIPKIIYLQMNVLIWVRIYFLKHYYLETRH